MLLGKGHASLKDHSVAVACRTYAYCLLVRCPPLLSVLHLPIVPNKVPCDSHLPRVAVREDVAPISNSCVAVKHTR